MLCSLIDHHDIAALVINVSTLRIVWASAACAALDGRLAVDVSLQDIPELFAVLPESLESMFDESQVSELSNTNHILARCTLEQSTINQTQPEKLEDSSEPSNVNRVNVTIRSISSQGNNLLLQFDREQGPDNYYRQYVADREKLFNTSRALTVNEMATTLAHELNQPIGTVVNLLHGCLDRLRKHNETVENNTDVQVGSDILDALDFAIRQSRFASQIISRVREFTEARQPSMEQLDIRVLVQDSVQLLDWVFESEHVNLSLDSSLEPLLVACDRMLLQQVLINLCRNAIEAMREMHESKRRLTVVTHRSDDGIRVDIADTGPGMEDDKMGNMFKPFVSTKRDGMGVGLNICRSFVELHQGRLWVTRNDLQGCTVHIQLPESLGGGGRNNS